MGVDIKNKVIIERVGEHEQVADLGLSDGPLVVQLPGMSCFSTAIAC